MQYIMGSMDNLSIIVSNLLSWLNTRVNVPVVYAQQDRSGHLRTPPHPYLEFIYTTHGSFRLHVGPRSAVVESGDLAVVNAHFGNHADFAGTADRYECVSFAIDASRELEAFSKEPVLEVRRIADTSLVHESYLRVIRQFIAPATPLRGYRLKCEAMLWLATVLDQAAGPGGRAPVDASRVERVLAHVQRRYSDVGLDLGELAEVAGVSPTHLCRVFAKRTGVSPARYVEQVRVSRAEDLLRRTTLSIKEIAYAVGYRDQLHFSRVFRVRTGTSPSAFRGTL